MSTSLTLLTVVHEILGADTALLWQKEASDIPSIPELLMFPYFT